MSKRLVTANIALLAVSALFATYIVQQATTPARRPPPARPRPAAPPTAPAPPAPEAAARPTPGSYTVIASRNLFSPTRTEAPPAATSAAPAVQLPKPNLYGVIVRDQASIAYLEDPTTKRVAGYRLGDSIAGGTVQAISSDRVVLARPDGNVDIRLHDPSRPKPAAPVPTTPGAPLPTSPVRPTLPFQPPGIGTQPQPQVQQDDSRIRRTLPPSLLRRLPPQPATGEGPSQ
jgi:hypothetical protein